MGGLADPGSTAEFSETHPDRPLRSSATRSARSWGSLPAFELKSLLKLVVSSHRRPAQVVTGGIGRNPSQPGRKGARIHEGIEVLVRAERHVLGEVLSGLRAAYAARVEGRDHSASMLFKQDAKSLVIAPPSATGEEFDFVILR